MIGLLLLLCVSQGLFQERWEKEKWKLSLHIIYPFKMANEEYNIGVKVQSDIKNRIRLLRGLGKILF